MLKDEMTQFNYYISINKNFVKLRKLFFIFIFVLTFVVLIFSYFTFYIHNEVKSIEIKYKKFTISDLFPKRYDFYKKELLFKNTNYDILSIITNDFIKFKNKWLEWNEKFDLVNNKINYLKKKLKNENLKLIKVKGATKKISELQIKFFTKNIKKIPLSKNFLFYNSKNKFFLCNAFINIKQYDKDTEFGANFFLSGTQPKNRSSQKFQKIKLFNQNKNLIKITKLFKNTINNTNKKIYLYGFAYPDYVEIENLNCNCFTF